MSRDEELSSRLSDLAASAPVADVALDDVKRRAGRRSRHQRMMVVIGAFALIVGALASVRMLDDSTANDAAADVEAGDVGDDGGTADGDGGEGADDGADATAPSTATTVAPARADSAVDYAGAGPVMTVAWGSGFFRFGEVFESAPISAFENSRVVEALPAEVVQAIRDSGAGTINEAVEAIHVSGLWPEVERTFNEQPELWDEYWELQHGASSFIAEVSDDGLRWTDVSGFELPTRDPWVNRAVSDGERLVLVESQYDPELNSASNVLVHWTTDLQTWQSVALDVDTPDVAEYVQSDVHVSGFAANGDGWVAAIQGWSYIDLWALLPDLLAQQIESGFGYDTRPDGVHIQSWPAVEYAEDATEEAASTYPTIPPTPTYPEVGPGAPTTVQIVPWSDLGITWEEYQSFESGSAESTVIRGDWAGTVTETFSPPVSVECCRLVATDTGFLMQWFGWESDGGAKVSLRYSTDGADWTPVDAPLGLEWNSGLVAIDGGVLLAGDGEQGGFGGSQVWRGESDGTGWEPIELPAAIAGAHLWFDDSGGRGVATTVDLSAQQPGNIEDPYEECYSDAPTVLEVSFTHDGSTFTFIGREGNAQVVIVDAASDAVIFDEIAPGDEEPEWFREGPDGEFEFLDADGDLVATVPGEVWNQAFLDAEDAQFDEECFARVEAEQALDHQPYYIADMWLVATVDGINWTVEDLPDDRDVWYQLPAINGDRVAVSSSTGEWFAFDLD